MTIAWRDFLEQAIIGKLVTTLIDDGFRVELSDQDGGGLFLYASVDGGERPVDGYVYWVKLVPGNGHDIIVDYTTNLETTLLPVIEFADHFEN